MKLNLRIEYFLKYNIVSVLCRNVERCCAGFLVVAAANASLDATGGRGKGGGASGRRLDASIAGNEERQFVIVTNITI